MKTRLLILIGIIFSGGFVITNAYAGCAGSLFGFTEPCFDSFMGSTEPMTQKSLMENFHKHMESGHDELQIPDRQWDNYKTPIQLPAILCTELVVDDMKQYRMAQWVDASMISSWENHYNPLLCTKWLAPIDDGIKIKWDKPSYLSQGIGILNVIDNELNLDNTIRDVFEVHVWSDIDHNGIQLTVTETDNDTGVFTAKVYFTTDNTSSGARLLVEDAVNAEHKGNSKMSKIINEPEEPTISGEQQQMMWEYCETGIRHPDMIEIPQCIKNEHTCDPGYEYMKGNCHIIVDSPYTYLRILFTYPAIMLFVFGVPSLIAIVVIYYIKRKRK